MHTLSQFLDRIYTPEVSLAETHQAHLELLTKRLENIHVQKTIISKKSSHATTIR